MRLRWYQRRTLVWLREALDRGARAPLLVCPTGFGKTVTLSEVARSHVANGGLGVVWLAHRRELERQATATLASFGLDVGGAGVNACAKVQVASVQGLLARGEVPPASLVIFDEAHHFAADDWGRLRAVYTEALCVGATATPARGDGRGMRDIFDTLIVGAQISELMKINDEDPTLGLVRCEVVRPPNALKGGALARTPCRAYLEKTPGSSAIVFAPSVAVAKTFTEEFRAAGVSARMVDGTTPKDERDSSIDSFRRGTVKVLCNVMVLTEGFDAPNCKTIIVAREVGNPSLLLQMTGRGLRPLPSGERCKATILDLAGVTHDLGDPDDDRIYDLDTGISVPRKGGVSEAVCRVCNRPTSGPPGTPCERCGTAAREQPPPTIVGGSFDKFARYQSEGTDKRAERLAGWIVDAKVKGKKTGTAIFKYKWMFKHFPTKEVRDLAERLARDALQ